MWIRPSLTGSWKIRENGKEMEYACDMQCGPFRLEEPIGHGGMGAVYRGRHRETGTPVAVKLLHADRARKKKYRRELRGEVQALARLNHPGVASVYDYGTVAAAAARKAGEPSLEGSPWIAMEFVDGETLESADHSWTWERFERVILALLDALSHAHAQEVVHRDLKPSNILVSDGGASLKVVDFGIAAVFDEKDGTDVRGRGEMIGTPEYMAPEQVLGNLRIQGPPTDLYAVGCLVWRLLCGSPPFTADIAPPILDAHLNEQPSRFDPRIRVPAGTDQWVRGLLAKRPWDRYRRAADAAWALMRLPSPADATAEWDGSSSGRFEHACPTMGTLTLAEPDTPTTTIEETARFGTDAEADERAEEGPHLSTDIRPRIPEEWERSETVDSRPMSAAGLELFRLRRLPLVDRADERDVLWETLRRVDRSGEPGAVLLEGPAGSGKSRLADWLGRRAHELGAAVRFRVLHSLAGGPSDGLEAAVLRLFHLDDLSREQAVEPLADALHRLGIAESTAQFDARAICGNPGSDRSDRTSDGTGIQPAEQRLAIARLLRAMADERPVVLIMDDIPWGRRSARFVRFLMDEGAGALPVVVVLTARRGPWRSNERVREILEPVLARDAASHLEVEPLGAGYQREMVDQMLDFAPQTVDELVDRSEGHPLFAIQMVSDWVERDLLVPGPSGFELREGARQEIPGDLQSLWNRRVDELLRGYADRQWEFEWAIELAATLGSQVDAREWRAVLEEAGLPYEPQLVYELIDAGLAEWSGSGWRFIHGMLVETIRERAEAAGRASGHHEHCARALGDVHAGGTRKTGLRRADHWLEAGDGERALAPLLEAVQDAYFRGDYDRQRELLERRLAVMNDLELEDDARARVESWIERGLNLIQRGDPEWAKHRFASARQVAHQRQWKKLHGRAMYGISYATEQIGDADGAFEAVERAEAIFEAIDDRVGLARCAYHRAQIHRRLTGDFERARELATSGRDIFERIGDVHGALRGEMIRCIALLLEGDFDRGERLINQFRDRAETHGNRYFLARAHNLVGELARKRGDLEEARTQYDLALRGLEACGSASVIVPTLNAALVAIEAGAYDDARERLDQLAQTVAERGNHTFGSYVHLGQCACAAGLREWSAWERALERARDNLASHDFLQDEHADLAETAAEIAAARGEGERAGEMYRFAREIWSELGKPEEAERVGRILDSSN